MPTNTLAHSAADIVRWMLIDRGQGTRPSLKQTWPIEATAEPATPDNCITLYDTSGKSQGRTMVDGKVHESPGVQLRIRATHPKVGWKKADALRKFLAEVVYEFGISITDDEGTTAYVIHALTNFGPVIALGQDKNNSARCLFTVNAMAVVRPA